MSGKGQKQKKRRKRISSSPRKNNKRTEGTAGNDRINERDSEEQASAQKTPNKAGPKAQASNEDKASDKELEINGSSRKSNNSTEGTAGTDNINESDFEEQPSEQEPQNKNEPKEQSRIEMLQGKLECSKLDLIMCVLTVLTLIVTLWIGISANNLNIESLPLVIENPKIEDDGEFYRCSFSVKQGKIKKAYLITGDNEKHYEELDTNLKKIMISKKKLQEKTQVEFKSTSDLQVSIKMEEIGVSDVLDFTLAILDYSNYWTCYYVIIRPEIKIDDKYVMLQLFDENDKLIGEVNAEFQYVPSKVAIIDTQLLSEDYLEEEIKKFNETDNIKLFKENATFDVVYENDGKVTHGTIQFKNSYKLPYRKINPADACEKIESIYDDLR